MELMDLERLDLALYDSDRRVGSSEGISTVLMCDMNPLRRGIVNQSDICVPSSAASSR